MKFFKFVFFIVLLGVSLTVAAQMPQVTNGSISIQSPPYSGQTNTNFSFGQDVFASGHFSRQVEPLAFTENRPLTGYTITMEPTQAIGSYWTCVNQAIAHPEQPLSTRIALSFAAFRVPRFPKTFSLNTFVEVNVPFTMTGRVSCLVTESGQVIRTTEAAGAGSARLRFKRLDSYHKRLYLTDAYLTFINPAPQVESNLDKKVLKNVRDVRANQQP